MLCRYLLFSHSAYFFLNTFFNLCFFFFINMEFYIWRNNYSSLEFACHEKSAKKTTNKITLNWCWCRLIYWSYLVVKAFFFFFFFWKVSSKVFIPCWCLSSLVLPALIRLHWFSAPLRNSTVPSAVGLDVKLVWTEVRFQTLRYDAISAWFIKLLCVCVRVCARENSCHSRVPARYTFTVARCAARGPTLRYI